MVLTGNKANRHSSVKHTSIPQSNIESSSSSSSPNLKTRDKFVSNYVYQTNFFILYFYFREAQIMTDRVCTTFYLPLVKLACIILKIEVYNTGPTAPLPKKFFYKIIIFFLLFLRRCTIISDLRYLILKVFLNYNNCSIFTLSPRHSLLQKDTLGLKVLNSFTII